MSILNQIRKKPYVAVCETCFHKAIVDLRTKKSVYYRICKNCKTFGAFIIAGKVRKFYRSLKIRWYKKQVKQINQLKEIAEKKKALGW